MSDTKYPKCEQELIFCNNNIEGKCYCLEDTNFNKVCPFYKKRDKEDLTSIPSDNKSGEKNISINGNNKFEVKMLGTDYGRFKRLEDAVLVRNKALMGLIIIE